MSKPPVAVFTFFSRTTCGHCKHFKGESTDAKGRSVIDPNSGWEVLTADRDLQNLGVEFQLYQFGPEKDPETGVVKNYALDEEYVSRVKGIPRLEMSVPDDPHNFVEFSDPELRGWNADQSVPIIKRWIIKHLQQEPFKSWRPKPKVARPPEVIMPRGAYKAAPPTARPVQPIIAHQQPVAVNAAPAASVTPSAPAVSPSTGGPLNRRQPYQPTARQQAMARAARAPMVRPQHGRPVVNTVVEEPKEEEPESDEENSGEGSQEKSAEGSEEEKSGEGSDEEVVPVVQRVAPPQQRPVQRQPLVKNVRPSTVAQKVATPRQEVQAPVVQAPRQEVQAPVVQAKPRFLPANWDN